MNDGSLDGCKVIVNGNTTVGKESRSMKSSIKENQSKNIFIYKYKAKMKLNIKVF